jgi:hypothetical protein
VDRIAQTQLVGESEDCLHVRFGEGGSHQVEPGVGVIPAPVEEERLDQVVLGLVGGDAAHEQNDRPAPVESAEPTELGLIDDGGFPIVYADQNGDHRGGGAPDG